MRDFGQSEHSFAQEDVHWSPGYSASAKKKEGEEERRFMHTVWTYKHTYIQNAWRSMEFLD